MNTEEKIKEVLQQVLTDEMICALNMLAKHIDGNSQNDGSKILDQCITQSEVLSILFRLARDKKGMSCSHTGDGFLDSQEVMQLFRISKRTLIKWKSLGLLHAVSYRNKDYFRPEDLNQLLMQNYSGSD